jgi:protein phosphatase
MPLAAVLSEKNSNNKVFAVHAGIGSSIQKIDDIEKIQRPLKITLGAVNDQVQQAAMDLLWSDPTPSEDTLGIHPNLARDPQKQNNISLYGADIVEKFLKNNQISMMIRANQICMDGMDRYANNQVFTITSCSNYNNSHGNDACFLVVQKKMIISPKIIKPSSQGQTWIALDAIPDTANSSVRRPVTPPKERKQTAE